MSSELPKTTQSSSSSVFVDRVHLDLWLNDGNIVLAAYEDHSSQRILFLVHKDILALHSSVFRALFEGSTSRQGYQATGEYAQYNGLPLLHMFDPAKDVVLLLEALYKPGFFALHQYDDETDAKLIPIIRLATKYQVTRLRSRLLSHFASNWPLKFDDFETKESTVAALITKSRAESLAPDEDSKVNLRLPNPFAALEMAIFCDMRELLPSIYYEIVRYPWVEGDPGSSSDKTNSRNRRKRHEEAQGYFKRTTDLSLLESEEIVECSRIRSMLAGLVVRFAEGPIRSAHAIDMCSRRRVIVDSDDDEDGNDDHTYASWRRQVHDPCSEGFNFFWSTVIVKKFLMLEAGMRDPLGTLGTIARDPLLEASLDEIYGLCSGCTQDLMETFDMTGRRWWKAIVNRFV